MSSILPAAINHDVPRALLIVEARSSGPTAELLDTFCACGALKLQDLVDATNRLQQDADAHLIVLYPNPACDLSSNVEHDFVYPDPDEWADSTQSLLDVCRPHRRRVTLIDADAAMDDPSALSSYTQRRLGLEVAASSAYPALARTHADLLSVVVSEAILRAHKRAGPLLSELEASSLPLRLTFDPVAVAEAWRAHGVDSSNKLESENGLLCMQLQHAQEELETLLHIKGELANRVYELENRPTSQDIERVREELQERKNDIAAIRASLSWRLTAPLRASLDLFTGGAGRKRS